MSQDIYGFNAEFQGSGIVTAKEMKLIVTGPGEVTSDYLVQNVAIQYSRPIQIIRELSTGNLYYHTLPPQGNISFGRIVGKNPITSLLGPTGQGVFVAPSSQGSSANTTDRHMSLKRIRGGTLKYDMFGCIVENIGISTDANSSFVQENVSLRFGKMTIEQGGSSGSGGILV